MRCIILGKLTKLLVTLAGTAALSGCYSMNGFVMNSSGQSYYEQGNYTAAAGEFQQAVQHDPTNPDYMANLAKVRSRLGDAASAEQLYRQALTVAPSHQPSYHGLAELMVAQGRGAEAGAMLNTWVGTQPYVAESHLELAWLQRQMGEHDQAAQSLQRALQVNPGHATAMAHLGQHYQDLGRPDQAIAMYQQSLQADWNQPDVHSRLAAAAQTAGGSHPMPQMAMARGVHPYGVPRQASVFGPPSQGAQLAQRQWQQPGSMQFAGMQQAPWQTSRMPMSRMPQMSTAQMSTAQMSTAQMPMSGAMSAIPPELASAMPDQQMTANSANYPSMQQALENFRPTAEPGWTVVPGSLRVVESGAQGVGAVTGTATSVPTTRSAALPMPKPDPTFTPSGSTGTPVKTISGGAGPTSSGVAPAMGLTAAGGQSAEPPVLDAF